MSHLAKAREGKSQPIRDLDRYHEKNERNEISPNRSRARLTPAHCLGPSVCAVVGVCGRMSCIAASEVLDWMDAVQAARLPTNPHHIPEFDPIEDEGAVAA